MSPIKCSASRLVAALWAVALLTLGRPALAQTSQSPSATLQPECRETTIVRASGIETAQGAAETGTRAVGRALADAVASVHGAFVSSEAMLDELDVVVIDASGREERESETRMVERLQLATAGVVESYNVVSDLTDDAGITEVVVDVVVCLDPRIAVATPRNLSPVEAQAREVLMTLLKDAGVGVVETAATATEASDVGLFLSTGARYALDVSLVDSRLEQRLGIYTVADTFNVSLRSLRDGRVSSIGPVPESSQGLTPDLATRTTAALAAHAIYSRIAPSIIPVTALRTMTIVVQGARADSTRRTVEAIIRESPGVHALGDVSLVPAGEARWSVDAYGATACSLAEQIVGARRFLGFIANCDEDRATIEITRE